MTTSKQRKAKARQEELLNGLGRLAGEFVEARSGKAIIPRDVTAEALHAHLTSTRPGPPLVELPRGFRRLLKA